MSVTGDDADPSPNIRNVDARPDRAGTRLLAAHTPAAVYIAFRMLAAENDRTIAEELHEAWRRHLVAEGKPVPPILETVLEEFRRYRIRRRRRD